MCLCGCPWWPVASVVQQLLLVAPLLAPVHAYDPTQPVQVDGLPLPTLGQHFQIVQATKRWWQCEGCKDRFATVGQKYPAKRCVK